MTQRKPNNLKVLQGTNQPCREVSEVEFEKVSEIPKPPGWLPNSHSVLEWERLAPILFGAGLLTEAGLTTLGHLCAIHGKIVQLYAAGESPNGALQSQLRGLSNDFGLTPVAQGKVNASKGEKKGNKFKDRK